MDGLGVLSPGYAPGMSGPGDDKGTCWEPVVFVVEFGGERAEVVLCAHSSAGVSGRVESICGVEEDIVERKEEKKWRYLVCLLGYDIGRGSEYGSGRYQSPTP